MDRADRDAIAEAVRQAESTTSGEIVVVIDRAAERAADAETVGQALDRALQEMSVKDAAAAVAEAFGLPRKDVYRMALGRGNG